ncbi:TPA: GNAT family N-acetyltransferase [Klebsiella pneumoniae]
MHSPNQLWKHCQHVYQMSRHPKEPEVSRELREGELIAPFYNKDKKLVAFISFTPVNDVTAHLDCCYVLPEYQGKGIATFLLTQLLKKCPNVFAETGNIIAKELYLKLGMYVQYKPYISMSMETTNSPDNKEELIDG